MIVESGDNKENKPIKARKKVSTLASGSSKVSRLSHRVAMMDS